MATSVTFLLAVGQAGKQGRQAAGQVSKQGREAGRQDDRRRVRTGSGPQSHRPTRTVDGGTRRAALHQCTATPATPLLLLAVAATGTEV